jgi:hypothetical protein
MVESLVLKESRGRARKTSIQYVMEWKLPNLKMFLPPSSAYIKNGKVIPPSAISLYGMLHNYIFKYKDTFSCFNEISMWRMEAVCKKWRSFNEEIVLKKIVNSGYQN